MATYGRLQRVETSSNVRVLEAPQANEQIARLWDRLYQCPDTREMGGKSNQVLVEQGQPVDHVFVTRDGLTESFFVMPPGGETCVLDMEFKGNVIGLVPAFLKAPHPISVRCVVPTCLLQTSAQTLVDLAKSDAETAETIAMLISEQSFKLVNLLTDLKLKSATQRLAGYLLSFNERYGRQGRVALPLRKKDLARCLGVTQQSLSRCIRKLQERGCLAQSDPIVIEDEDALRFFYQTRWQ